MTSFKVLYLRVFQITNSFLKWTMNYGTLLENVKNLKPKLLLACLKNSKCIATEMSYC